MYNTPRSMELTLNGKVILTPYPILRIGSRILRGYYISYSRFRTLDPIPHARRVLAVDASIKVLYNCGPYKIVVSKIVWGLWKGFNKRLGGRRYAITVVWSKSEAAEWLLKVELQEILKRVNLVGRGDYVLLDRALMAVPALRRFTRERFERLDKFVNLRGAILIGVCKSSRLKLNTGEGLIGYLAYLAERRLRGVAWYYYPVFRPSTLPPWYIGDIVIARLNEDSEEVFRIDISRRSLLSREIEIILGEIAFLQDHGTPGYPYPLKGVHDESKISDDELRWIALRFLDELKEKNLLEKFIATTRSTSFKERYLWGI
ncbi:MAG: hypothetical protein DRJ49_02090 [Thermoprotei archaeon]|nr:MAG: hypothetical protein DRJ49_02090 [Thermoprotei archaeon]